MWIRLAPPQGFGVANGAFGEFIQGPLGRADRHNLVTLPIALFSKAAFLPTYGAAAVVSEPPEKRKAARITERLLRAHGRTHGGVLALASDLPEGKGMASSSADMVAAARAVFDFLNTPPDLSMLEAFMAEIEPTDGVMHQGVVSYLHREGRKVDDFGAMFPCSIPYLDEGGVVDTIAYNKALRPYSDAEARRYAALHQALKLAFEAGDLREIGRIATKSARLNQSRNPKRSFGEVCAISHRHGGLGVVVTHSGPCIGVLVDRARPGAEAVRQAILQDLARFPGSVGCVEALSRVEESARQPHINGPYP